MHDPNNDQYGTRRLDINGEPVPMPLEDAGTDDYPAPWVIELRVVGTPSVIQAHVTGELIIGRSDVKTGVIPHIDLEPFGAYKLGISRRHAVIFQSKNRLMIRDLESSNGTSLNDYALKPDQNYRVRHGDTITVGRMKLQVLFAVMPQASDIDRTQPTQPVKFEIPQIGNGHHLLLVDDDTNVTFVLKSVLEQAGLRVTIAHSFREAISALESDPPELVLQELMLPDVSGLDLVRHLRESAPYQKTPLMIVTNATGGYQMGQALEAGIDVFVAKPIGIDELLRGVSKLISQLQN